MESNFRALSINAIKFDEIKLANIFTDAGKVSSKFTWTSQCLPVKKSPHFILMTNYYFWKTFFYVCWLFSHPHFIGKIKDIFHHHKKVRSITHWRRVWKSAQLKENYFSVCCENMDEYFEERKKCLRDWKQNIII